MSIDLSAITAYTPADLPELVSFVGKINAEALWCVSLHPGDVLHYLSNGLRGADAGAHLALYREAGE